MFAIVDRFESAPKLPFGRAFFPEGRHASELRDEGSYRSLEPAAAARSTISAALA